jgi:hypothetical protein
MLKVVGPSLYEADGKFIVLCNNRRGWATKTILQYQVELDIIAYGIVDVSSQFKHIQPRIQLKYFINYEDMHSTLTLYPSEHDRCEPYDCDWRYATEGEILMLKNMVLNDKITLIYKDKEETLKYFQI